jgi:hypothetical protein
MKLTATNAFHNTAASFELRPDGTISAGTYNRVKRELCGNSNCRCTSVAGNGDVLPEFEALYEGGRLLGYQAVGA